MRAAQLRVHEVLGMLRRRWKMIVFPTILIAVVCTIGAYMLPRKYESTTTMLVRPDQSIRSLSGYDLMAAFEEQLRNISEILMSRSFLEVVVDSMGYFQPGMEQAQREAVVSKVSSALSTSRLGSDSFSISYTDSDPRVAQKGASMVANLFILTKTELENRQNQQTVDFLERKVEEYRLLFEASTRSLVSSMQQDVNDLPTETRTLYSQVNDSEHEMAANAARLKTYQDALAVLSTLADLLKNSPEVLRTESGKQPLLELQRERRSIRAEEFERHCDRVDADVRVLSTVRNASPLP